MKQRSSTHRATCGNSSLTAAPALAVLPELPGRAEQRPGLGELDAGLRERQGLAVVALEQRLVVERVDVRRPPLHEQEDDPLGPGRRSAAGAGPAGPRACGPTRRPAPPRPAARPGPASRTPPRIPGASGGARDRSARVSDPRPRPPCYRMKMNSFDARITWQSACQARRRRRIVASPRPPPASGVESLDEGRAPGRLRGRRRAAVGRLVQEPRSGRRRPARAAEQRGRPGRAAASQDQVAVHHEQRLRGDGRRRPVAARSRSGRRSRRAGTCRTGDCGRPAGRPTGGGLSYRWRRATCGRRSSRGS